ncbi:kinase-like protein [Karstenula rhodostoma CBS 690.94]|uniref:Kinase-like protein n=1 Tax=Karstenula rhodostoma CBS 690.94 TaxID=1392251 RepID=A0A9P4P814_9PLEO|nr:kinase-like protein [Karstenula rhodostoma CBS 690.94]
MRPSPVERWSNANEANSPPGLAPIIDNATDSSVTSNARLQAESLENEGDVTFQPGKGVNIEDNSTRPRTSVAPIIVPSWEQPNGEAPQDNPAAIKSPHLSPLEANLRTALEKYRGDAKYEFLPLDVFDQAIQVNNVAEELRRWHTPNDANRMAENIMGKHASDKEKNLRTKRKIFAILGLMEKTAKVVPFIKHDICDHQLPFLIQEKLNGRFEVNDRYGKRIDHDIFKRRNFFEGFHSHQWEVLAPYFELSLEPNQKITHYDLNLYPGLPFIKNEQMPSEGFEMDGQGGYAQVRRVKIHPAHHSLSSASTRGSDIHFAVKRLRRSEEEYKQRGELENYEAQVLRRLNDLDHTQIIRLLGSFSYKGHFHMIFPWANGNLQDFWNSQLDSTARASGRTAHWLCQQMLGITDALSNVHDTQRFGRNADTLLMPPDTRTHGRHGDIKPENILWFEDNSVGTEGRSPGILKLADFGLADFHSKFSKSGANAKGVTGTYQAPEFDVVGVVSQKYDMWSLGCVLMEFIVWYVDGWDGVDSFSKRRSEDTASGIRMDNFYDVRSVEQPSWDRLIPFRKGVQTKSHRRATLKPSVAGIQRFLSEDRRTSKACSDFVFDVLDLVHEDLLRMNPGNRADCDKIVRKLTKISANCLEDSEYCTRIREPIRKRPTHRSELSSSEMSTFSQSRMEPSNVEADTRDAAESIPGSMYDDSNLDENAPLMGEYNPIPLSEERRNPLQTCLEYIWGTLRSCLGFEDARYA